MLYKGIETENYREDEFIRLPRLGKKSLEEAKRVGAKFAPDLPDDNRFDPTAKGAPMKTNPSGFAAGKFTGGHGIDNY